MRLSYNVPSSARRIVSFALSLACEISWYRISESVWDLVHLRWVSMLYTIDTLSRGKREPHTSENLFYEKFAVTCKNFQSYHDCLDS